MSCITVVVGLLIIAVSNALSLACPAPKKYRKYDDNRNNFKRGQR